MNKLYLFCGLQRSGNHALINWILSNQNNDSDISFLNNIQPGENPFLSCTNNLLEKYSNHLDLKKEAIQPTPKDVFLISYEDQDVNEVFSKKEALNLKQKVGESKKTYKIVILRDPFNFFASRINSEHKYQIPNLIKRLITNWFFILSSLFVSPYKLFQHNGNGILKLFQKWRRYFSYNSFARIPLINHIYKKVLIHFYKGYCDAIADNKEIIFINFNQWFSSETYRKELALKLNLNTFDKGVKQVAVMSTFSSNEASINPDERWKKYVNDDFYRSIFNDQQLVEKCSQIFGKDFIQEKINLMHKYN